MLAALLAIPWYIMFTVMLAITLQGYKAVILVVNCDIRYNVSCNISCSVRYNANSDVSYNVSCNIS